jgi:hypothetical protein
MLGKEFQSSIVLGKKEYLKTSLFILGKTYLKL